MYGRRAARELALMILFQLDSSKEGLPAQLPESFRFEEAIRSAVQCLVRYAKDQLEDGADRLKNTHTAIQQYEFDHPTNLNAPLEAAQKPVPLPTTQQAQHWMDQCLMAIEVVWECLHVPELLAQAQLPDVKAFTVRLVETVMAHKTHLDSVLEPYCTDWKPERLMRMDRLLLRLALAELLYEEGIDPAVSINEAVDLAKQFSQQESFRFINGVLGRIAADLKAGAPLRVAPEATTTTTAGSPSSSVSS